LCFSLLIAPLTVRCRVWHYAFISSFGQNEINNWVTIRNGEKAMSKHKSLLLVAVIGVVVFGFAAVLLAQQVDTPSDSASAVNVSGQWKGVWRQVVNGRSQGAVIATITQSGATLTGEVTVKSTPCGDLVVPVKGVVSGTVVDVKGPFSCEGRRQQLRFQGGEYRNVFIGGGFFVYQGGQVDDGGTFYMNKR
jgi:preprotein translocase subunit SecY